MGRPKATAPAAANTGSGAAPSTGAVKGVDTDALPITGASKDSSVISDGAEEDAVEAGEAPALLAVPDSDEWPLAVTIWNHSSADLSCRVSGAYLPAAGWANVSLHDPDHAQAVAESLTQLAAANFIGLDKLVIAAA